MLRYRMDDANALARQPVVRTHSDLKNINLAISDVLKQRADDWVIEKATIDQDIDMDSIYPTVELRLKFFDTNAAMEFYSAMNGFIRYTPIASVSAVSNDGPTEIDNFSNVD